MQIKIETKNDVLIAELNGEIDHHSAEEIRNKVENELKSQNLKNIVMNFKGVRFMDSSGIGVIIGRYKYAKALGGNLVACELTTEVKRIFDISGLLKIVEVYDDCNDALASFQKVSERN